MGNREVAYIGLGFIAGAWLVAFVVKDSICTTHTDGRCLTYQGEVYCKP